MHITTPLNPCAVKVAQGMEKFIIECYFNVRGEFNVHKTAKEITDYEYP